MVNARNDAPGCRASSPFAADRLRMSRLRDHLLPTDVVRWISVPSRLKDETARYKAEIAVLDDAVVWCEGRVGKAGLPRVALDAIDFIEAEEGGSAVSLYCGGKEHRIEEIVGGKVSDFARATGRPARIWRKCTSPAADLARRWHRWMLWPRALMAGLLPCLLYLALAHLLLDAGEASAEGGRDWVDILLFCVSFGIASVFVERLSGEISRALTHWFVGRFISLQDRQDFVCTTSDDRWDGVKPTDPRPLAGIGPLQRWAMRQAYGEVPDVEPWELEVVNDPAGGLA